MDYSLFPYSRSRCKFKLRLLKSYIRIRTAQICQSPDLSFMPQLQYKIYKYFIPKGRFFTAPHS